MDTVSSAYYHCNTTTSTKYYFNKDTCIEFDVETESSTFRMYVRNGTNPYKLIPNGTTHIKITVDGTNILWDIGGTTSTSAFAYDSYYFYFKGETVDATMTFKNFKIYPI